MKTYQNSDKLCSHNIMWELNVGKVPELDSEHKLLTRFEDGSIGHADVKSYDWSVSGITNPIEEFTVLCL